ncbi:AAA family ATPase [Lactiplantibacillus plantarum]|uniref:AAA family ATPase n=1 Tax=Lactiplantibacillus plantarum TaxID=1590 RepID=UPI0029C00939|nr:AAA family ATPase [Lactiplantibacillus plantarum]WPG34044.1 AAA family ATPase [Lactiplantibacillus plantarum]
METTLVIIRGNSGSGKTTLAQALQRRVGHHTLLVSQDVVRRDMLMSHDYPGNISIGLIEQIACYGLGRVPVVIVEDMRRWWFPHDTLGVANEVLIGEQQDLTTEVQQIMTAMYDCD